MESVPKSNNIEKEEKKTYLYHLVPEDMMSDVDGKQVVYPLNVLKEKFPGLYQVKIEKYNSDYRKTITDLIIPTLEQATWGDVVQLTAVHPVALKRTLVEAGYNPKEMKFYQIDPALLDPEMTTIYLYKEGTRDEDKESFAEFHPEKLEEYSGISSITNEHYKKRLEDGKRPLLFVGIPHILHKGAIDVSNFPVIVV